MTQDAAHALPEALEPKLARELIRLRERWHALGSPPLPSMPDIERAYRALPVGGARPPALRRLVELPAGAREFHRHQALALLDWRWLTSGSMPAETADVVLGACLGLALALGV